MMRKNYSSRFFEGHADRSYLSAREIVPLIIESTGCRSIIDVGCGNGTWLRVFREQGVTDTQGIDGDYVDRSLLQIPPETFLPFDLTKPLRLERTFDLAVSLEVAEHLPETCASAFVESLTRLAPVILFSAAIPFQGGTHHINEQWPQYWADLFEKHGYGPVDMVRDQVWESDQVEWWYAQNTLLYVHQDRMSEYPQIQAAYDSHKGKALARVHPGLYVGIHYQSAIGTMPLRQILPRLPEIVLNSVKRRLRL